ncbi:threonine synthase, partial [bacterium]|nr:threonine synthase [bacterium]
MKYYSTNRKSPCVTFKEALIKGQAPDKGLYMPETIPVFSKEELSALKNKDYYEIAYAVLHKFLHDQIEADELMRLVKDAYDFSVPLEHVVDQNYVMRLDQGPTASFKDFAARMMGRLMQYYLKQDNQDLLILTATSGDTGSAIANAFYGLDNIKVVVLFPEKEVSDRQRKQMTTLGKNIAIIGLDAKFDDCQALVKQAFADSDLDALKLSSANSINIGRLIPQAVYYVYAYVKLTNAVDDKIVFSVPSGNFGDMMGGLLAKNMGVPIEKFVIVTNENNEVPLFLETGSYKKIEPSKNCLSSAMNVGHPSNLARVVALYGGQMDEKGEIHKQPDLGALRQDIYATSITDEQTKEMIKTAFEKNHLLLEPHGAVGWAGLEAYAKKVDVKATVCVSLETAHPAKFPELIREILTIDPE